VFLCTEVLINFLKQSVTVFCNVWWNRKQSWIVLTEYINAFLMIMKINSINQLVFCVGDCVLCEIGTDFLYIS